MAFVTWHDGRLAAFDIETTGTDIESDRIVTAAISLVGGGKDRVSHDWLVDPGVEIPAEATAVHGVTTERARSEGIPAARAVEELTSLLAAQLADDVPVVAFNARFDLTILDREARRHEVEPLIERVGPDGLVVVDPYVLDKQLVPRRRGPGARRLGALCAEYGIPLTNAHAADADALAAARLAWRMANRNPRIAGSELFELHENQVLWAAEQAASLEEFFRSKGRNEHVEPAWPIVPPQAAAAGLGHGDRLAA